MSLIGPRPLLPRDQPANPSIRLSIRPGITGWAQVNGGTLLSASEKDALDEWYMRNASWWLDFRIIVMTLMVMIGVSAGPTRNSYGHSRRGSRRSGRMRLHSNRQWFPPPICIRARSGAHCSQPADSPR
jgi:hypothetical protein